MGLNDDILHDVIGHKVDLMRYSETLREKIVYMLLQVLADIHKQINDADLASVVRTDWRISRQEALIRNINDTLATQYDEISDEHDKGLVDLGQVESQYATDVINSQINVDLATTTLSPKDLETIAGDTLILGAPSKEWWQAQAADTQMQFASQIRLGVSQGETNDEIVRRIRGTATGNYRELTTPDGATKRVPEFTGGVMDLSTRNATALVRTSVQAISNKVLSDTWDDNDDIIKGKQWVSTLDLRTTPTCRGLDGGQWDNEGNPLPDSPVQKDYPGDPPIHWNCRSVTVPILKSWEELSNGKIKGADDIPESTRASMDGQVPASTTYDDWLKGKSEADQKEVLGEGRWQLWKDGKLTMADMIDQTGNPLTLDELKAKAGQTDDGEEEDNGN